MEDNKVVDHMSISNNLQTR